MIKKTVKEPIYKAPGITVISFSPVNALMQVSGQNERFEEDSLFEM